MSQVDHEALGTQAKRDSGGTHEGSPQRYRVGPDPHRSMGRTIYRGEELIGIMDTAEDAQLVVESLNARDRVWAGRGTCTEVPPLETSPFWGES